MAGGMQTIAGSGTGARAAVWAMSALAIVLSPACSKKKTPPKAGVEASDPAPNKPPIVRKKGSAPPAAEADKAPVAAPVPARPVAPPAAPLAAQAPAAAAAPAIGRAPMPGLAAADVAAAAAAAPPPPVPVPVAPRQPPPPAEPAAEPTPAPPAPPSPARQEASAEGALDISGYVSIADLERVIGPKIKLHRADLSGVAPSDGYNALYYQPDKGSEFGVAVQVWRDTGLSESRTRYNTMRNTYSNVAPTNKVTEQGFRSYFGSTVTLVFADPRRPLVAAVTCSTKFCNADALIELSHRVAERLR